MCGVSLWFYGYCTTHIVIIFNLKGNHNSRTEIRKEWENCWDRIQKVNPIRDYKELEDLNKRFDECVEAYYAVDCGSYWKVNSASRVNGKYKTYWVKKELN